MSSVLTLRNRIAGMLGISFGGKRDLYNVFGYHKNISYGQSLAKYGRQDIVARVIDAPADALWTKPPTVITTNEAWNNAWQALVTKHQLWQIFGRVDRLAGIGEYSTLLIGFDDANKVDKSVAKAKNILYLQPYSCEGAQIKELEQNTSSNNFMKPSLYTINPNRDAMNAGNNAKINGRSFEANGSRILHVVENPLTDEVYGNCRMERVFNLTDDLLKVAGGTAETFWLTANRGMQIDVDKEMELTPDDEKALADELEEFQHQQRRYLRTRGVKVNSLGSDIPNPEQTFRMLIALISGATGIPTRILLGSEAGQLASTQDRNNWAERIIERRTTFGEPQMIKPFIRKLTAAGVLPQVDEQDIKIQWPEAFVLSPLERAQAGAQRARSAANMAKTLDTNNQLLTIDEAREALDFAPRTKDTKEKEGNIKGGPGEKDGSTSKKTGDDATAAVSPS